MTEVVLRDYQNKVTDDARRLVSEGVKKIVIQAATGSGKTVIASEIISGAQAKGNHLMFLAHRRELVYQCYDKLRDFGVRSSIIMAGEYPDVHNTVQVASIDTLRARVDRHKIMMPRADILFIDEAHRSLAPTYMKLIEHYSDSVIIGLTATPIRADGKGLGQIYDGMVKAPSMKELIKMGYLVQPHYYAPSIPDLTGVKTMAGDYHKAQLAAAMDRPELIGDVVTNWVRIAEGMKTVVFASSVEHSIHLMEEFKRIGIRAAHIDGTTSIENRDQIIKDLRDNKVTVICNCMVLTEGFDCPDLQCCVLARPTKNLGLYLQMGGRVLRPFPPFKDRAVIIDHSGAVYRHGFLEDDIDWQLEDGILFNEREHSMQRREAKEPITCIECAHVYSGQVRCPECGHMPETQGKWHETRHADLMEVSPKEKVAFQKVWSMEEKRQWWGMFIYHCAEKEYREGWAFHKFQEKFGIEPHNTVRTALPIHPTREFRAWMRHKQIAWAKSKDNPRNRSSESSGSSSGGAEGKKTAQSVSS